MSCEKVLAEPKEGDVVWCTALNTFVTLGPAATRFAKTSDGTRVAVNMTSCQTHEARVQKARDNMIMAIEAYSQLAGTQQNTTSKE